jgi:hypothetical protein
MPNNKHPGRKLHLMLGKILQIPLHIRIITSSKHKSIRLVLQLVKNIILSHATTPHQIGNVRLLQPAQPY